MLCYVMLNVIFALFGKICNLDCHCFEQLSVNLPEQQRFPGQTFFNLCPSLLKQSLLSLNWPLLAGPYNIFYDPSLKKLSWNTVLVSNFY